MQFVTAADGRTLCFAEWGRPDGYPVVLFHGSPNCRLGVSPESRGIAEELGIRLIMHDRPGYGHSDRRGPETTVADHVEDLEAILAALGVDEFVVSGGPGGAPPALAVAARLGDRVSRVSNYGALAPLDLMGDEAYTSDQDDETKTYLDNVRTSVESCTAFFEKLDAEYRAAADPNDPIGKGVLEQCRLGVAGWVDDERALQFPWGFDVADVRVPTVIYANPNDLTTPPNHAEWLAGRIEGSQLVTSTNSIGHCAIDDPTRARRALYAWLVQGGEPVVP